MAQADVSKERWFLWRIIIVTLITFAVIYGMELLYGKEIPSSPFFWIQMVTGSSWPNWADASKDTPVYFAIAATVHVMLNVGPLLVVLWIGWTLVLSRRWKMDLKKAFQVRDMDVKLRIKNIVFPKLNPEERKYFSQKLDEIFDDANDELEGDLNILATPRTAQKVRKSLEENMN